MADGIPARSHRLRCLGNSIVPQIAEELGRAICAADNRTSD
jgi:site-specific DNA-cytosine methylase